MKKLTLLFFFSFVFIKTTLALSCDDSIPYCKNMSSCSQAKFYLEQCGVDRLDRDGDGIPCENVCGKSGKVKKNKSKKVKSAKNKKHKNTKKYK